MVCKSFKNLGKNHGTIFIENNTVLMWQGFVVFIKADYFKICN